MTNTNATVTSRKTIGLFLETEAIYITKTGWDDYHVITEFGDLGESKYQRMSGLDIFKKYKINPNILLNNTDDTRAFN